MSPSSSVSIGLVVTVSALLVVTGLRKQPGLGVLGAVALIAATLWWRDEGLASIGFGPPPPWGPTLGWALALGVGLQLVAMLLIDPWTERVTGTTHDYSVMDGVRGNWGALALWLVLVWTVVAFLEEGIYRGFMMTEIARVIGTGTWATVANVVFTAVVFGFSHGYQGRAGMISTAIVGAALGVVFVASGYDVWLAIFTHGIIDTVGLGLIALGADRALRRARDARARA